VFFTRISSFKNTQARWLGSTNIKLLKLWCLLWTSSKTLEINDFICLYFIFYWYRCCLPACWLVRYESFYCESKFVLARFICLYFIFYWYRCCLPAGQAGLLAAGKFVINHCCVYQNLLCSFHLIFLFSIKI